MPPQNQHKREASYIFESLSYFIDFALPFCTLAQNWFFLHYVIIYGFFVKNSYSMGFYHFFNMLPKIRNHYRGCKSLPVDVRSLFNIHVLVL